MADEEEEEADDEGEGEVDWEGLVEVKTNQLRALLTCRIDGLHEDDDYSIRHLLHRRELTPEEKAGVLTSWCASSSFSSSSSPPPPPPPPLGREKL